MDKARMASFSDGVVAIGRTLWANLHLLFWLSLIPFGTNWLGHTSFAS